MRQPSLFVTLLLILTGFFLVFVSLVRGEVLAAAVSFTLFFTFWMALQIQRDPHLTQQKTRRYLRMAALIGALAFIASLAAFVGSLVQGHYSDALQRVAPAILVSSIAWRYRKDWPVWLRTEAPATKDADSQ